jgi:ribonucleoside-diphosphate reductase alpha chain
VYHSTFPTNPHLEAYLRSGRIISEHENAQDMVTRIVATLEDADARFDPAGAGGFGERLGWALDTERIVFSTPIMTNAGRHLDRPLAACAVPPVDLRGDLVQVKTIVDSYHRAGMGTGFALDELDDPVGVLRYLNDIAVTGAASAMEDRPVGNMAILSLDHPAAEEFIGCKVGADARGEAWKFNISLQVTDAHMRAALRSTGRERDLLTAAAEAAHTCADPGLLFADRMNESNPTPHIGDYVSTAPCAEVGLISGETCQFGYLNLGRFRTGDASVPVDLGALADTTRTLVRALDDAIEASLAHYPSPLSTQVMTTKRKIGIGVCGLADLLLSVGLPYDSVEGRQLTQEVLALVNYTSKLASVELARTRGGCPAVLDGRSRYADPAFLRRFATLEVDSVTRDDWAALADKIAITGLLRNSSTIAIPPTGRSAPVVRASTGIEPLFRLSDDLPGHQRADVVAALTSAGRTDVLGFVSTHGRLPADPTLPKPLRAMLATATEISPSGHLAMAAAVQACVDEAVSKTVNLPRTARPGDVYNTYAAAFELGCKGITVYVDGSRSVQPQALATSTAS